MSSIDINLKFSVEGVVFPESIAEALKENVRAAIEASITNGHLTAPEDTQSIVKLESVNATSPSVYIEVDNGRLDRVFTNVPGLEVNAVDLADAEDEENIFVREGNHFYLYSTLELHYLSDTCDDGTFDAQALKKIRNGNFVSASKEEFVNSTAEIEMRDVFHSVDGGWSTTKPSIDSEGLIESGYELFFVQGSQEYVLHRFASEKAAKRAMPIFSEIRSRLRDDY
ncbi:hypothetical protein I7Z51_002505 [Vibrio parahaemolyticus]|uniref:hypothetical protein n=1 Tax=Vibrio TaxID=662 RepID=UPI001A8EF357|nr:MULTISPECIES: hypothetical protein [Vibrio]EGQ7973582.1 hypothetical protein [Vibrio parahaemolyticus]MBO0209789.1 hypothetical protein [Vibrio sp. Vb0877]MCR9811851.1 hypothetical protein [Vibrio parahaemolyticus]MDW2320289.1 hypothetical protein [Vibrio sp. 1159]